MSETEVRPEGQTPGEQAGESSISSGTETTEPKYFDRFSTYFNRPVAEKAAGSLSNGVEIQIELSDLDGGADEDRSFFFRRDSGRNQVLRGRAKSPDLTFRMTRAAAEEILGEPAQSVGAIGVGIAKLMVSGDPTKKVEAKIHCGILSFLTRGYLGVIASGGKEFASFLATKGLVGIAEIKKAIQKMRSGD